MLFSARGMIVVPIHVTIVADTGRSWTLASTPSCSRSSLPPFGHSHHLALSAGNSVDFSVYLTMVPSDDRDGLLYALQSMGVQLSTTTKLSTKNLEKKLKKALHLSQRMKTYLRGGNSLDISLLEDWGATSVLDGLRSHVVKEAENDVDALRWHVRSMELGNSLLQDLWLTMMRLAMSLDERVTRTLLFDKKKNEGNIVVIRVS